MTETGPEPAGAEPDPFPRWVWPAALAVVGLSTQARARAPALWQGDGDAAKYAALARQWPDPALFDAHPYLIHPGGYPAAVALVGALTGLEAPQAASLLGGLCWVGLALLTFVLGRRALGLSPPAAFGAGLLLLVSRAGEVLGQGGWREPLQTLGLYALLGVAWWPTPTTVVRRRLALVAAALLGAGLAAVWDLFALLVPALLVAAWALRRPPLLAAGVALALCWGSWAGWRHDALTAGAAYPAGIDGTWESTERPPPLAWLNPNFLPDTARHNAYFWPPEPTPLRPLRALAPWACAEASPHLTQRRPGGGAQAIAALLGLVAALGVMLVARAPPPERGALIFAGCCAALLGGPALVGLQARYGAALLPALALLVGRTLEAALERAPPRARPLAALGVGGLTALLWLAGSAAWSWTRPQRFEGEAPAGAIAAVDTSGLGVGTLVGLAPDLVWGLPGRRVVTLPGVPEGLDDLLETRSVGALVLPHEVHPWQREGADPAWRDAVYAVPTLAALHRRLVAGELTYLGVALEAERCERLRVRAYDVLWRGPDVPRAFGFWLDPDALGPLGEALERGLVSPETRRLLRAHRGALERQLSVPDRRAQAQRVLDAL